MRLIEQCKAIEELFKTLEITSGRSDKDVEVEYFKQVSHPELVKELDFCFEVLAGKYKLGFTYIGLNDYSIPSFNEWKNAPEGFYDSIINFVKTLKTLSPNQSNILSALKVTPIVCRSFIYKLVNRLYKLGYSNKHNMITNLSPMLAKKYPDNCREQFYYTQEKLDGHRTIAFWDTELDEWAFQSRSGKRQRLSFDMSWADPDLVYDGETMSVSDNFNATSGRINSKYLDKSNLEYVIYDIIDTTMTYQMRLDVLLSHCDLDEEDEIVFQLSDNCRLLPVSSLTWVHANPDYNWQLDRLLDKVVSAGGEGIMLRDPDGLYEQKRSNKLLKYKKLQTMDLRIIDWNEGKGKYENAIGSFVCQTDDEKLLVNVSGMSDHIRFSEPDQYLGKIIEVAYFEKSKSKAKSVGSLRFPRIVKFREDKNETSEY